MSLKPFATLGGFSGRSPAAAEIAAAVAGLSLGTLLLAWLLDPHTSGERGIMIAGLGLLAVWRHCWALTHYLRAWIYYRGVYPLIRARAMATPLRFEHVAVVITSYRIDPEVNAAVYEALFRDLADYGAPATVVACVTDPADARQLAWVAQSYTGQAHIDLVLLAQSGKGKRDAMSQALAQIRGLNLPCSSAVVLMDGDSLLPEGALRRCLPILLSQSSVGAITLDNEPLVRGSSIAREWYRLRMAQRHVLMCSLSLSRRLLVLTGRFSVFRGEIACNPAFAAVVRDDRVQHWRFGEIKMLTGDDKSTWYWTMSQGWDMLYVPDVSIQCLEEPPSPNFLDSTTSLMRRWYGNMVRNGTRALKLGWRRVGAFPYAALIDQKLSMWTTLIGPTLCLALAVVHGPRVIGFYALWVMATRGAHALSLWLFCGRFSLLFPPLLYYTQSVGACMKIWATFHPNVQKWTRQHIAEEASTPRTSSTVLMALSITAFLLVVIWISGVLEDPR